MSYDIKQRTQADCTESERSGDQSGIRSIVATKTQGTKYTLSAINFDDNAPYDIKTDESGQKYFEISQAGSRPLCTVNYNTNGKILSIKDNLYNKDTGGGAQSYVYSKLVKVGGEMGRSVTADYYKFSTGWHANLGFGKIIKLGYCSNDNEGKDFPIFIKFQNDDSEKMIYPSKEGMYEFQPETWRGETIEVESEIEYILVPMGFDFVLDYVIE